MTKTVTTPYDVAEHLRTPEEMAAYLEACLERADGGAAFVAKALGDIARAKGMTQVARDAGLSRESLYKALSGERSPGFDTILKVMRALGLKFYSEREQAPVLVETYLQQTETGADGTLRTRLVKDEVFKTPQKVESSAEIEAKLNLTDGVTVRFLIGEAAAD